jgi:hypothetical protein
VYIEEETREMRVEEGSSDSFPICCAGRSSSAHKCLWPALVTLEGSRLIGMNDAQKTVNLLERMEFMLDSLSAELRIARIDRGEVPAPSTQRINAVREAESALTACDFKRRESIEGT